MVSISSDVIRGYNDTMILFLLRKAPSYGYEISKEIKELTDEKYVIKETTLYSAFNRMEKKGLIESYSGAGENGKKRTYYRITNEGKRYYDERCDEWNVTKEVVEKFIDS
ncbi:MAG: PadR family transcriptional regulator [Lachnospiraceae bacterium]|nr:PadR family transcriptional regulator [Lachnospiraceae bacterium]